LGYIGETGRRGQKGGGGGKGTAAGWTSNGGTAASIEIVC